MKPQRYKIDSITIYFLKVILTNYPNKTLTYWDLRENYLPMNTAAQGDRSSTKIVVKISCHILIIIKKMLMQILLSLIHNVIT